MGDPLVAAGRLALLAPISLVPVGEVEIALAHVLRQRVPLPPQAREDALHIAITATRGMAYLLTWDSKHIANPRLEARIRSILLAQGYVPPVLCTPNDLMENR